MYNISDLKPKEYSVHVQKYTCNTSGSFHTIAVYLRYIQKIYKRHSLDSTSELKHPCPSGSEVKL